MTAIATQLDDKLKQWDSETGNTVTQLVSEIIELADQGVLDLLHSRSVEQEVLDILDDEQK